MMFPRFLLLAACAVVAFPGLAGAKDSSPAARGSQTHRNIIPPRLQWEANGGYCGEVSFISAGLYYGQYMSQYDARICAIGDRKKQNKGELLLGSNDQRAARAMHLNAVNWDGRRQKSTAQFLRWVKDNVLRGYPTIIGVYNNENQLYGSTNPTAGDPQYDHIVGVMRIRSHHPLTNRRYFGNDRLTLTDNGLWGSKGHYPYHFSYDFDRFPGDRAQANAPDGPLYTLPNYGRNYGVTITGVTDLDGDTVPVRIRTDKNYERPSMPRGGTKRPRPEHLELTITISDLKPGVDYRLYRYNTLSKVPDSQFNAHAGDAAQMWHIRIESGSTFTIKEAILSDEIAVYRCVPASAK